MMGFCDLHVHSNYSDGVCTPREVLEKAKEKGLKAVALTDHNTIKGLNEFMALGKEFNIETIAGTEITCEFAGKEIHMLALFLKPENYKDVENLLYDYVSKESARNVELAEKLSSAGYKINYAEMLKKYGENINRVHFAKELLNGGYVTSIQNAFDTVLNESAGFYTVPKRLDALSVIKFIKEIGAVPVWAHPRLSLSESEVIEFLTSATPCGLVALETDYSTYTPQQTTFVKEMAERFNLLRSGGSDFHGSNKPTIQIGVGKGNLAIPYEYCKKLKGVLL